MVGAHPVAVAEEVGQTEADPFEAQVAQAVVPDLLLLPRRLRVDQPFRANRYLLFPSSSRTVACSIHAPSIRATKSRASSNTST